jgi:hypothetical protein
MPAKSRWDLIRGLKGSSPVEITRLCFLATCSLPFCKHWSNFLLVLFSKSVTHICENFLTQVQVVPVSSLQPYIYFCCFSLFIYSFVVFFGLGGGFSTYFYQENCAIYQWFLVLLSRVIVVNCYFYNAQNTWLYSVSTHL